MSEKIDKISEKEYYITKDHSDIFYYVNEDEKTVNAVIQVGAIEFDIDAFRKVMVHTNYKSDISSILGITDDMLEHVRFIYEGGADAEQDRDEYFSYIIGKAKCHENDTFDLEFGKKLARARCLKKYYKYKSDVYNELTTKLNAALAVASPIAGYHSERSMKFSKEESELLNNI